MQKTKQLLERKEKLAIIGLGYVGLPLALAYAKHMDVVGFDLNREKIHQYQRGVDILGDGLESELKETSCLFTYDEADLDCCTVFIVAVPTPIDGGNNPDFTCLRGASELVGNKIKNGALVVYESTVYPGATEEICIPILEQHSALNCPSDFSVGYSPERINPSDKENRLDNIVKIVSGVTDETCQEVADLYKVIVAQIHQSPSIAVAEAAKVMENSQRDVNIAFINEYVSFFDAMGIGTKDVLDAMGTKWNALGFTPGLVGGHCIGVDPYYSIHQANQVGVPLKLHMAAREINEQVPYFLFNKIMRSIQFCDRTIGDLRAVLAGVTYKPNCSDTRNSKAIKLIELLRGAGIQTDVYDTRVNPFHLFEEHMVKTRSFAYALESCVDILILAEVHDEMKEDIKILIDTLEDCVVVDVYGSFFDSVKSRLSDGRITYISLMHSDLGT